MDFDPEITQLVEDIRQDRVHGASRLSLQAVGTLRLAAEKSSAVSTADFLNQMKAVARELAEVRPSMAPIANLVALWFYEITQEPRNDLTSLRSLAVLSADRIIRMRKGASNRLAEHGAQVIEQGDRLITCSDSSAISRSLRLARLTGKEFNVFVAESRSSEGKLYGEAMAVQLGSDGVSVQLIPDEPRAISDFAEQATKAIVGADSILDNGTVINGSPTLAVAQAASEKQIPFYVLCETTKFSALRLVSRHLWLEEGFDVVPAELITRIITEEGTTKVDQAAVKARQMAKYLKALWE